MRLPVLDHTGTCDCAHAVQAAHASEVRRGDASRARPSPWLQWRPGHGVRGSKGCARARLCGPARGAPLHPPHCTTWESVGTCMTGAHTAGRAMTCACTGALTWWARSVCAGAECARRQSGPDQDARCELTTANGPLEGSVAYVVSAAVLGCRAHTCVVETAAAVGRLVEEAARGLRSPLALTLTHNTDTGPIAVEEENRCTTISPDKGTCAPRACVCVCVCA